MEPFHRLRAVACPLSLSSIDTDQLLPARFMKRTRAEGYGPVLLHDMRFDNDGRPLADFPLNQPEHGGAQVIVARRNFGCGSSREAAVYALVDYGIRCVIAPSFGDIFASNSVNNGLLPARVSDVDAEGLLADLTHGPSILTVDLEAKLIETERRRVSFDIAPAWRAKLLNGWDDIDLTLSHREAITAFIHDDTARRPWARPHLPASKDPTT